LSYSVKYEDIGLKDYKETWIIRKKSFRNLSIKKRIQGQALPERKKLESGTLIFVEHPTCIYTWEEWLGE